MQTNFYKQVKVKDAPAGFVFHKIELLNLFAPGSTAQITVDYALTQYLNPLPKEIEQAENQLVFLRAFIFARSDQGIGAPSSA